MWESRSGPWAIAPTALPGVLVVAFDGSTPEDPTNKGAFLVTLKDLWIFVNLVKQLEGE